MTLHHACVDGPAKISCESPFIVTFVLRYRGDDVIAALIGNLARVFYKTLRIDDIIKVDGRFVNGSHIGYNQVFVVEKMDCPKSASTGRNLNVWG